MKNLFFLIEGGRALDLVKTQIAQKKIVRASVREMARELGVVDGVISNFNGNLLGVVFPGDPHPEFTKPNRKGHSHPKKKTAWAQRFADAPRHKPDTEVIAEAMNVPIDIDYERATCSGSTGIGYPFQECGFLGISDSGPFAMWIPDVPAEVAAREADGYTVAEPAKSFVPVFDGCRRIEEEEWDILVAQHKLKAKQASKESVEETPAAG